MSGKVKRITMIDDQQLEAAAVTAFSSLNNTKPTKVLSWGRPEQSFGIAEGFIGDHWVKVTIERRPR
jgi:hypothetical protein